MNCATIDSFLDDHLIVRLSPSERQRATEHVSGCARCSAAWAADDALRGEAIAEPAPELFAAVLRRLSTAPARSAAARRRPWAPLAAAAAVAIVAVAAGWVVIEKGARLELAANAITVKLASVIRRNVAAPPDVSAPSAVTASPFVAGRDYEVLSGATARLGGAAPAEEVEVIEFFMWECFPCFAAEPELSRWEAEAPSGVFVTRVPAMFNAVAQLHARAYYTAEALGKLDAMGAEFYDEIHVRGNPLASRDELADFFGRFGVDRATFDLTFDSSGVDARIRRAAALVREYAIQAAPTVVVGGRYATNPLRAGTALRELLNHLVAESKAPR